MLEILSKYSSKIVQKTKRRTFIFSDLKTKLKLNWTLYSNSIKQILRTSMRCQNFGQSSNHLAIQCSHYSNPYSISHIIFTDVFEIDCIVATLRELSFSVLKRYASWSLLRNELKLVVAHWTRSWRSLHLCAECNSLHVPCNIWYMLI